MDAGKVRFLGLSVAGKETIRRPTPCTTLARCNRSAKDHAQKRARPHQRGDQLLVRRLRQHLQPPAWFLGAGVSEIFELVAFSSYEVVERAPYLGKTRLTVGKPTWKTLDRKASRLWWGRRCKKQWMTKISFSRRRWIPNGRRSAHQRLVPVDRTP